MTDSECVQKFADWFEDKTDEKPALYERMSNCEQLEVLVKVIEAYSEIVKKRNLQILNELLRVLGQITDMSYLNTIALKNKVPVMNFLCGIAPYISTISYNW